MADEEPQQQQEAAPPEGENGTAGQSLDSRMSRVEDAVSEIRHLLTGRSGQVATDADDPLGIKREAREAAEAVKAKEDAKQARAAAKAAEEDRIQSLEDQVGTLKAAAEEKPMEYRRATNMLGWAKP